MKEIWVAGYPSKYGGADTELWHNCILWRRFNIDVNLVPMYGKDREVSGWCDRIGCKTHQYNPAIFKDKVLVSYCNGEFLKQLPKIMTSGRPKKVIWHNTMTYCFESEKNAHQQGWIDYFGFVSNYQEGWIRPKLEKIKPVQKLEGYIPYFDIDDGLYQEDRTTKTFNMGRVSRDDPNKFSMDMWKIFYKVCAPRPTKTFVLGWSKKVAARCGAAPDGLDWMVYAPNAIPVRQLYHMVHAIIHKTGGSRESYCRIVPEAYAHGCVMIAEDDYAFPDLIVNGETGFRCKTSDEMSYRASEVAFNPDLRLRIVRNAREFLRDSISNPDKAIEAWEAVL